MNPNLLSPADFGNQAFSEEETRLLEQTDFTETLRTRINDLFDRVYPDSADSTPDQTTERLSALQVRDALLERGLPKAEALEGERRGMQISMHRGLAALEAAGDDAAIRTKISTIYTRVAGGVDDVCAPAIVRQLQHLGARANATPEAFREAPAYVQLLARTLHGIQRDASQRAMADMAIFNALPGRDQDEHARSALERVLTGGDGVYQDPYMRPCDPHLQQLLLARFEYHQNRLLDALSADESFVTAFAGELGDCFDAQQVDARNAAFGNLLGETYVALCPAALAGEFQKHLPRPALTEIEQGAQQLLEGDRLALFFAGMAAPDQDQDRNPQDSIAPDPEFLLPFLETAERETNFQIACSAIKTFNWMLLTEVIATDPELTWYIDATTGNSLAHVAAAAGNAAAIGRLSRETSPADQTVRFSSLNIRAHFPLLIAAERGHTQAVLALIGARARVNQADLHGRTALMIAVQKGHWEIVRLLLAATVPTPPGAEPGAPARARAESLPSRSGPGQRSPRSPSM